MIDQRIASMARAINRQTADLARDTARQIKNVWICEDGKVSVIEDPMMLRNKVNDDQKVLSDMLRQLDELLKERDGIKVSSAVQDTASGRNGSNSDASETE